METLKIPAIVSKFKQAETNKEKIFFLSLLENSLGNELKKTKRIKKELEKIEKSINLANKNTIWYMGVTGIDWWENKKGAKVREAWLTKNA